MGHLARCGGMRIHKKRDMRYEIQDTRYKITFTDVQAISLISPTISEILTLMPYILNYAYDC